jgi:hypothetical protein
VEKAAVNGKKEKCYSVKDIEPLIIINKYITKMVNVKLLAHKSRKICTHSGIGLVPE